MTLRDQSSSLLPFTRSVAQCLREAGEDQLSAIESATEVVGEEAIERVGVAKAEDHVRVNIAILNRNGYAIGYKLDEDQKRYFLVRDAERATDEPGPQVVLAGKDDQACAPRPVDGSLSADTPAERSGAADGERSVASPAAGSSVAPSEGRLFELPSTQHFDVKAEAA